MKYWWEIYCGLIIIFLFVCGYGAARDGDVYEAFVWIFIITWVRPYYNGRWS